MPKIDVNKLPVKTGSIYPDPYARQMVGRSSIRVGDAGGLTQFGANIVILEPNAKSSLRHWHLNEDEFVIVSQGEVVLIDDHGETPMVVGECATFPAGDQNGHHFVNRSKVEARFLVVGTKAQTEIATYSDIDLMVELGEGKFVFKKKDGSPV
jgi:uncharacterized cupin superfamily protein